MPDQVRLASDDESDNEGRKAPTPENANDPSPTGAEVSFKNMNEERDAENVLAMLSVKEPKFGGNAGKNVNNPVNATVKEITGFDSNSPDLMNVILIYV